MHSLVCLRRAKLKTVPPSVGVAGISKSGSGGMKPSDSKLALSGAEILGFYMVLLLGLGSSLQKKTEILSFRSGTEALSLGQQSTPRVSAATTWDFSVGWWPWLWKISTRASEPGRALCPCKVWASKLFRYLMLFSYSTLQHLLPLLEVSFHFQHIFHEEKWHDLKDLQFQK